MTASFAEKLNTYLQKKGAAGNLLPGETYNGIRTAVVVPLIAERENIAFLLDSLEFQDRAELGRTLFLFVVNNARTAAADVKENNAATIEYLRARLSGGTFLQGNIIDCSSAGNELPEKDAGVGLARKTGLDTALSLFSHAEPENLLICLDGDCRVRGDYLSAVRSHFDTTEAKVAAIQYEHLHPEEPALNDAITRYEIFLRYYVLGLRLAGSPFAHHSIGSTMAFTAGAYIACEGMNKYKAGEDFYFLEKARKQFPVTTVSTTRVYPSPRMSWRVPFGTGRGVTKILNEAAAGETLYNPESFLVLRDWLRLLREHGADSPRFIAAESRKIHPALASFLTGRNFENAWSKIQKSNPVLSQRQQMTWFDGFATLKLMHHLRDNGLPDVPIVYAAEKICSSYSVDSLTELSSVSECLTALRGISFSLNDSTLSG